MADLVKLRLPNGNIIERPRKIAKLFIRGGAEEILPAMKPKEVGTKTTQKTPPPIDLKPEITKPEDSYPGGETQEQKDAKEKALREEALREEALRKEEEAKVEKEKYIASLKKMNKDVLIETAKKKELSEDEWINLTKPKLVEYLTSKA